MAAVGEAETESREIEPGGWQSLGRLEGEEQTQEATLWPKQTDGAAEEILFDAGEESENQDSHNGKYIDYSSEYKEQAREDERLLLEELRESMERQEKEHAPGIQTETKALEGIISQDDASLGMSASESTREVLRDPRCKLQITDQGKRQNLKQHSPSAAANVTHGETKAPRWDRENPTPALVRESLLVECAQPEKNVVTNSFASKIVKSDALREVPCPKCKAPGTLRKKWNGPGRAQGDLPRRGRMRRIASGNALRTAVGAIRAAPVDSTGTKRTENPRESSEAQKVGSKKATACQPARQKLPPAHGHRGGRRGHHCSPGRENHSMGTGGQKRNEQQAREGGIARTERNATRSVQEATSTPTGRRPRPADRRTTAKPREILPATMLQRGKAPVDQQKTGNDGPVWQKRGTTGKPSNQDNHGTASGTPRSWAEITAAHRPIIDMLPPETQERVKRARERLQDSLAKKGRTTVMKEELRSIMPRSSILCLDFVGRSVLELVIDAAHRAQITAIMGTLGYKLLEISSPLQDFLKRPSNRATWKPAVQGFYSEIAAMAMKTLGDIQDARTSVKEHRKGTDAMETDTDANLQRERTSQLRRGDTKPKANAKAGCAGCNRDLAEPGENTTIENPSRIHHAGAVASMFQYVAVATAGVILVGIYVSPVATTKDLMDMLTHIKQYCTGIVCIAGDWNARHRNWDRMTNRRGLALVRWAEKEGWVISTPHEDTFRSSRGSTKNDFYVHCDCSASRPQVVSGIWDGVSKAERTNKRRTEIATEVFWQQLPQDASSRVRDGPESSGPDRWMMPQKGGQSCIERHGTHPSQPTGTITRNVTALLNAQQDGGKDSASRNSFKDSKGQGTQTQHEAWATGPDHIFPEALQLCPSLTAKAIIALWGKCGELATVLKQWLQALFYPIQKKGDRSEPRNYRPIALPSHARKIVEKAIDWEVREHSVFSSYQCGFRARRGVETALIRYQQAIHADHRAVAVLDLKGAYSSVPRGRLVEVLQRRLPRNLVNMISILLRPEEIQTVGDSAQTRRYSDAGLPQGSPLSPSLFNLYIDELAGRLALVPRKVSELPANLFADDVLLMAANAKGLQRLLDICTEWADEAGLYWSGKNALHCWPTGRLSQSTSQALKLQAPTAQVGKAWGRVKELQTAGLHGDGLGLRRSVKLFKTFVRPLYEYGIHLTQVSLDLWEKIDALEAAAVPHILPSEAKRQCAESALVRIPYAKTRRMILADNLRGRIKGMISGEEEDEVVLSEERWLATGELAALEQCFPEGISQQR
eukprot:IDg6235t1